MVGGSKRKKVYHIFNSGSITSDDENIMIMTKKIYTIVKTSLIITDDMTNYDHD